MMVDDQVRMVASKIPDAVFKPPELPSDLYATYIKQNPIGSLIAMYYTLQVWNYICYCVRSHRPLSDFSEF